MKNEILIIPDVHGRTMWREPLMNEDFKEIIFLGDYLDPYPHEHITMGDAMAEFSDILKWARVMPDKITLLLGNHDAYYWWMMGEGCRYDERYDALAFAAFRFNEDLFKLVHTVDICGKTFVFSHAGVMPEWLHANNMDDVPYEDLNALLKEPEMGILDQVSWYRGGDNRYPSLIWADMYDFNESEHRAGEYQIFGHTQSREPSIMQDWACLDCHVPFVLNTDTAELKEWGRR